MGIAVSRNSEVFTALVVEHHFNLLGIRWQCVSTAIPLIYLKAIYIYSKPILRPTPLSSITSSNEVGILDLVESFDIFSCKNLLFWLE